jgi:hypothetical protein
MYFINQLERTENFTDKKKPLLNDDDLKGKAIILITDCGLLTANGS